MIIDLALSMPLPALGVVDWPLLAPDVIDLPLPAPDITEYASASPDVIEWPLLAPDVTHLPLPALDVSCIKCHGSQMALRRVCFQRGIIQVRKRQKANCVRHG